MRDSRTENPARSILMGLDGEMSGKELGSGHRLIQAGLAFRAGAGISVLNRLIGWDPSEIVWDKSAEAVHRIPLAAVVKADRAAEVDLEAVEFIQRNVGDLAGRTIISVGFNVGAFDHPFFRATLPESMRNVSRRAIDLNSICFAMDGWPGQRGRPASWQRWKKEACLWAGEQMATQEAEGGPHQAGWDAGQALYVLEFLRSHIHRSRPAIET